MALSAPFARLLAAGRADFNARMAAAKRQVPGFDTDAFAAFLQTAADSVVVAVAAEAPESAGPVASAAYDIGLTLVAHGLIGPTTRHPLVGRVWTELAPRIVQRVVASPTAVLGGLCNAALNLSRMPSVRGDIWLQNMAILADRCADTRELLALGQVLAWRSGAAHLRAGALAAADRLPPALALAALGAEAPSTWDEVKAGLLANPWWSPERASTANAPAGREVGNFAGFGGIFPEPPQVRPAPDGFWVKSADRYSLLIADAWGAVLAPASEDEFAHPSADVAGAASLEGARIVFGYGAVDIDLPAEGLALVCNAHSAALVSPYTYAIRLYPLK